MAAALADHAPTSGAYLVSGLDRAAGRPWLSAVPSPAPLRGRAGEGVSVDVTLCTGGIRAHQLAPLGGAVRKRPGGTNVRWRRTDNRERAGCRKCNQAHRILKRSELSGIAGFAAYGQGQTWT